MCPLLPNCDPRHKLKITMPLTMELCCSTHSTLYHASRHACVPLGMSLHFVLSGTTRVPLGTDYFLFHRLTDSNKEFSSINSFSNARPTQYMITATLHQPNSYIICVMIPIIESKPRPYLELKVAL